MSKPRKAHHVALGCGSAVLRGALLVGTVEPVTCSRCVFELLLLGLVAKTDARVTPEMLKHPRFAARGN